jgi:hypothetical protein
MVGVSDNPAFDRVWLDVLAKAGGPATFGISMSLHAEAVQRETAAAAGLPDVSDEMVRALLTDAGVRPHRALDDCVANALRRAAIAMMAVGRDRGSEAAEAMRRELVGRARRLLEEHGRR